MRIADRYAQFTPRVGTTKTGAAGATTAPKGEGPSAVAKTAAIRNDGVLSVSVSDAAGSLADGAARLDELKAQIVKGTFKIDARAIAKSLVGDDE